jgi:hypothetical protein
VLLSPDSEPQIANYKFTPDGVFIYYTGDFINTESFKFTVDGQVLIRGGEFFFKQ